MNAPLSGLLAVACLLSSLSGQAQQRIAPVVNLDKERINEYSDHTRFATVIDSILYFGFTESNPQAVYGSDGSAPGTRVLSMPGNPGAEVVFGFAHRGDYYYVTRHYLDPTELRRANFAEGSDERVAFLDEDEFNHYFNSYAIGSGRTILSSVSSDSISVHLLDEQNQFSTLFSASIQGQSGTLSLANLIPLGPDSLLLQFYRSYSADTLTLVTLAIASGNLDTLSTAPAYLSSSPLQVLNGRIYSSATVDQELILTITTTRGVPVDTLNFGAEGNPTFADPATGVDGDVYLSIRRNQGTEIYYYRQGETPVRVGTTPIGSFPRLARAPGPLGDSTLYLVTKLTEDAVSIFLVEDGILSDEVVSVPTTGFGDPRIVGMTSQGLLLSIGGPSDTEELYFTDGTPGGSGFLSALNEGGITSWLGELTVSGDQLYFTALTSDDRIGLFRTEADATGLTLLTEPYSGYERRQYLFGLMPFRGGIVFRAAGPEDNTEWWIVPENGPTARKLIELDDDSESTDLRLLGPSPSGELLFTAYVFDAPSGLFRTAGTPETTELLLEDVFIVPYRTSVQLGELLIFPGGITRNGEGRYGLVATDGTADGTQVLYEGEIVEVVVSQDRVFFSSGTQLYVTDGTVGGTQLVLTLNPVVNTPTPLWLAAYKDGVLFEGLDDALGYGVWFSDGTAEGTRLVKAFRRGDSYLAAFAATEEYGFFVETHSLNNTVWRTDGTPEGTVPIKTLDGRIDYGQNLLSVTHNGLFYFNGATEAAGRQLWVTDGTEENTRRLPNVGPAGEEYYVIEYLPYEDYVLYSVNHGLYRTDGTSGGTVRIFDGLIRSMTIHDGLVYFSGETEKYGSELYQTDGTPDGTRLVEDYNPGTASAFPSELTSVGSELYFVATHPRIGSELHHLVACTQEDELLPVASVACSPILVVALSATLGERSATLLESDGLVDVTYYADYLEFLGAPGTTFTAELSLSTPTACGSLTRTVSATLPGTESACLTSVAPTARAPISLHIYPNPTTGRAMLELPDNVSGGLWQVFDLNGRSVAQGQCTDNLTPVDLSMHARGVYFVRVVTGQGEAVRRLVVQ